MVLRLFNLLVSVIVKVRWLSPFADITRGTTEHTDRFRYISVSSTCFFKTTYCVLIVTQTRFIICARSKNVRNPRRLCFMFINNIVTISKNTNGKYVSQYDDC